MSEKWKRITGVANYKAYEDTNHHTIYFRDAE